MPYLERRIGNDMKEKMPDLELRIGMIQMHWSKRQMESSFL
jgi:hypothetical protein